MDVFGAYPRLSPAQIARLTTCGAERTTGPGDVLYRAGDIGCAFHVILQGKVALVEGLGEPDQTVIGVHGSRRFLGELGLLTGQAAFVSAVVHEPGAVLVVPPNRVLEIVAEDRAIGDLILRAYLIRRSMLIDLGIGLKIIGSRFSEGYRRLREFAARNRLPHTWIDLEEDDAAESLLAALNVRPDETPVVIFAGRTVLRNPSNSELAEVIGLRHRSLTERDPICDLAVIGAGPAGLAAALYGSSEGLETIMFDAVAVGGQAATSSRIENYLGFPAGISGGELAERAVLQARKFGAGFKVPAEVVGLQLREGCQVVVLDDDSAVNARAVVVATGVRYHRLHVPRLEEFEGISVHYAATDVEARACRNDPVAVIGGGNSAGQATVFLARQAARVRLVIRSDDVGRNMSRYLVDRIARCPEVEVITNSEVRRLVGEEHLSGLEIENNVTGERWTIDAGALFVFIGGTPSVRWLGDVLATDDDGFILTGPAARASGDGISPPPGRPIFSLETSRSGVFAVGDVRSGSTKRVLAAMGEGSVALAMVHHYLEDAWGAR